MAPARKGIQDISLNAETISLLEIQAEREGSQLKEYIEQVLEDKAQELELSKEYRGKMNELLDKHAKDENNYLTQREFLKKIAKK